MSDIFVTITKKQSCCYFKGLRPGALLLCTKTGAKDRFFTAQLPGSGALGFVSGQIFSKNDGSSLKKLLKKSNKAFYAQVVFSAGDALVCRVVEESKKNRQRTSGEKVSLAV